MEDGEVASVTIMAEVITKRAFQTPLSGWDNAFKNYLCLGGNLKINSLAANQLAWCSAHEA